MKKGCVLFLIIFGALIAVEWYWLSIHREDISPFLSILFALLITASIANLYGIYHAFYQKRLLNKQPQQWKDGELIGISGRIHAIGEPLTAPGSGKRVALYEYDVTRIVIRGSGKNSSRSNQTDYTGFGMAPCTVQSKRGAVRLVGFPMLAHFSKNYLTARTDLNRLVDYLSTASITRKEKGPRAALKQLNEVLRDADGDVLVNFRDDEAITEQPTPETAESFRTAFFEVDYTVEETIVENSAQVTAFGTYRTNPARLEVGGIFDTFTHSLFPGEGAKVTAKNLRKSAIAFVIFTAITVGVHYFVYPQFAAVLRGIAGMDASPA